MRAVVKLRAEPDAIDLVDLPIPETRPGEALIRIAAAGICGTDVALWRWHENVVSQYAPHFPLVLGHEFGGVVEQSGSDRVPEGAMVGVNPQLACRRCRHCLSGRPTLCPDRTLLGGRADGGWAEYVRVPQENLLVLPAGTDPAVAALLEPLAVATHAVHERTPVRPGDSVLVIGAGPIGLLTALLALDAGAGRVVVTDTRAERLEHARALGATAVDVSDTDVGDVVRAEDPDGADLAYETSGNVAALPTALGLLRRAGRLTLLGLAHVPGEVLSTPVVVRELEVVGSRGYNDTTWSLLGRILPRIEDAALQIVSRRMPLDHYAEALRLVSEGASVGKIVLTPA